MVYVIYFRKPMYVHFYVAKKKLSSQDKQLLSEHFNFYRNLSPKQQLYFDHRVVSFIKDKDFIGRDHLDVTCEMKLLISAHAVILTFGFRDFFIGLIDKIFIYPDAFYSATYHAYHAGEINPMMRVLVISWSDFKHSLDVNDLNTNLGIYEFSQAIHLNCMKERDVSSTIFSDTFKELASMLTHNESLRQKLIQSHFFRGHASTTQFEFLAVILETFIKKPSEFRLEFPNVYAKTKQMLNFDYAGY
ncbi:zinc-dependent peptidase [Formosa sediminum]|nr:zinc-dependent peptidase [Formosa sediminum]